MASCICFKTLLLVLALAVAHLSTGCASVYQVSVDAAARPAHGRRSGLTYRIEDNASPANARAEREEIRHRVRAGLHTHGLVESEDPDSADVVVEIIFGIGPQRMEQKATQPLAFGRPIPITDVNGRPPEGVAREMMGYTSGVVTTAMREMHLSVCARESRGPESGPPAEELWRVGVRIDSETEDLRALLPILTAVAMEHIGRTTIGTEIVKHTE